MSFYNFHSQKGQCDTIDTNQISIYYKQCLFKMPAQGLQCVLGEAFSLAFFVFRSVL